MISVLPDSSVRPTIVSDVPFIGDMHATTMRATLAAALGHDLPEEIAHQITGEALAQRWAESVTAPPSPAYRTFTALEGPSIVGFAATAPADQALVGEPDENPGIVEILALEVPRNNGRKGHGSRMLAAIAEFAEKDRVHELQVWIMVGDEARTRFFDSAGFAPRGIQRTLALGSEQVTEQCWYAVIEPESHDGHSHT